MTLTSGVQASNQNNKPEADKTSQLTFGRALKYSMLPGILPRVRKLGEHFGMIAYMMAMIFYSIGLLPKGHPMLNAANTGRYGITDVIATAANNLQVSRGNIDKVLIFCAVVLALIMVVIQAIFLTFYAFIGSAKASGGSGASGFGMFTLPQADQQSDVVLTLLQQTIGAVGGTNIFNNSEPVGFSIAHALHQMLSFYSTAMLVIAVMIVLYYIVVVVGEAAQTGRPFGGRFNSLWAPVRLVVALGLLVPLGSGLNSGQYLVLYTAKAGSSLASNAWYKFADVLSDPAKSIAPAYPQGMTSVAKSVFLMNVCQHAYNEIVNGKHAPIERYVQVPQGTSGSVISQIQSSLGAKSVTVAQDASVKYVSIKWYAPREDVGILWNSMDAFACGGINFDYDPKQGGNSQQQIADNAFVTYMKALAAVVEGTSADASVYAKFFVLARDNEDYGDVSKIPQGALPDSSKLRAVITEADKILVAGMIDADFSQAKKDILGQLLGTNEEIKRGGWGVAASYYTKIAHANGLIAHLVASTSPEIAEVSSSSADAAGDSGGTWSWFTTLGEHSKSLVKVLTAAEKYMLHDIGDATGLAVPGRFYMSDQWKDDMWITKLLKGLVSIDALQHMADPENVNVFPMVHLTNLGRDLIEKAVKNVAFGAAAKGIAGWLQGKKKDEISKPAHVASALGSMLFFLAFIGLGIGFVMAIVVPLLPFVYFFFAIIEWAAGILEAMVGVPLWALAHLRIEGDGMPGPAAGQGYFIIFAILIRPILILFSLFASFVMFNAGAYFLNLIFGGTVGLIMETAQAASAGDAWVTRTIHRLVTYPIQLFGYLLMYAVIVYNLGMVSFKMIDQIPAQVMRWMGQGRLHYEDNKVDPIGDSRSMAMLGGAMIGQQVFGGVTRFAQGFGKKPKSKGDKDPDSAGDIKSK